MRLSCIVAAAFVSCFASTASGATVAKAWHITGVQNGRDIRRVNAALAALDGVTRVFTTLVDVRVTFNDARVGEDRMKTALRWAGPYELSERRIAVTAAIGD